jgi:hypothetical protein
MTHYEHQKGNPNEHRTIRFPPGCPIDTISGIAGEAIPDSCLVSLVLSISESLVLGETKPEVNH